jgi:hypothetical protein
VRTTPGVLFCFNGRGATVCAVAREPTIENRQRRQSARETPA